MSIDAIIVLIVIAIAVILFVTDKLSIDLVALIILTSLTVTGVLTPAESLRGFSNSATITVAFMFVLSNALLKTGSLQRIGPKLGDLFKNNFNLGLLIMIIFVGICSAFVNNTPIVAMFIPVMQSVAHQTKISPSKLLIPLSYASIFGGTCTLIGTSTNMLVSGIAEENGLDSFSIFLSAPIGLVFLIVGALYLFLVAKNRLPDRGDGKAQNYAIRDYTTEIEILDGSQLIGTSIMHSVFRRDIEVDIIEVRRNGSVFTLPPGDFEFKKGDVLKIRSNVEKIKEIKDRLRVEFTSTNLKLSESEIETGHTTILELVITSNSDFEGKTLRQLDFRRMYRAIPLAIVHKEEVLHEKLHDVPLKSGDLVLIEIKTHRLNKIKREEMSSRSPFVVLSEEGIIDFDRKSFLTVISVLAGIILLSATGLLSIVASVILGTVILILTNTINMRELYGSIEWKIVFLLAGTLSLGVAMNKTGLSGLIANAITGNLGEFGPIAVLAGLYLATSLLTEIMSNNATAALFAPIAIATAEQMDVSPIPFLMGVMLAASSSFMTPIGYQTNAMVFAAGRYRFRDFFKVGVWLNLIFWIIAVILIPIIYPF